MKKKSLIITTIILIILATVYTVLVKTIDVQAIGPEGSSVGFATINGMIRDFLGYNNLWYKISKYLGIIPFLIVAYFAFIGASQLYERRSLLKVDTRILLLGCFYILLGLVYVLFEKVIINYRPFLQDGVLEASYPSSHTMLALCICTTAIYVVKFYIKNKSLLKAFDLCSLLLMIGIVVSRFISGVHWLTDIIGGIIISITLVFIYLTSLKIFTKDKKRI